MRSVRGVMHGVRARAHNKSCVCWYLGVLAESVSPACCSLERHVERVSRAEGDAERMPMCVAEVRGDVRGMMMAAVLTLPPRSKNVRSREALAWWRHGGGCVAWGGGVGVVDSLRFMDGLMDGWMDRYR